ncbi:MAG: hypothetical protein R3231_03825 [bacterium]|nr:hypothetical protein [bacterium]
MDTQEMLEELESVAEGLGIKVRYEKCKSRGGLCRVRNEPMIIVRKTLSVPERLEIVAQALGQFPMEATYLKPEVRDYLERLAPQGNEELREPQEIGDLEGD